MSFKLECVIYCQPQNHKDKPIFSGTWLENSRKSDIPGKERKRKLGEDQEIQSSSGFSVFVRRSGNLKAISGFRWRVDGTRHLHDAGLWKQGGLWQRDLA